MRNGSHLRFTVAFSGLAISEADPVKTSKRLSVQNPVRHQSGGYYAWIFADGKETWKSLKTDFLKVAQVKLREVSAPIGKTAHAGHADQRGNMTMEHCAAIFTKRIEDGFGLLGKRKMMRRIGESTQRYRKQTLTALGRSWPALTAKNVRRNTGREVGEWAEHFAAGYSASRLGSDRSGCGCQDR